MNENENEKIITDALDSPLSDDVLAPAKQAMQNKQNAQRTKAMRAKRIKKAAFALAAFSLLCVITGVIFAALDKLSPAPQESAQGSLQSALTNDQRTLLIVSLTLFSIAIVLTIAAVIIKIIKSKSNPK